LSDINRSGGSKEDSKSEVDELRRLEYELLEHNESLEVLTSSLSRSERRFRELAESIADPFFALDSDLRYTYWNKASERLTGISSIEALGKSIYEIFPADPENRDAAIAVYKRVLEEGRPETFVNEFSLEGDIYFFSINVYPIEDGITVFVKDITKIRRTLEELRSSNQELDAFALVVSHDLSSSMVFVEDFARRAMHACAEGDRERVKGDIEQVIIAVIDTRQYIEQLQDYARAGYKEEGEYISCCGDILREVIGELAVESSSIGAEIVVKDDLPHVAVNPLKLRQVFHNLISNALDHAHCERLYVEVGTNSRKGEVRFHVMDNGKGIAPDEQADIFLPFKRMQDVETEGMGLGLSIAKRAVESWGGRIWVESSPGEGCCFFFTAPSGIMS
jgi:PAS domain S-box-containing protein